MSVGQVEIVTPRQVQVIRLLAEGLANKEIAARLGITSNMAGWHCDQIRRRLDVAARRQIPFEFMRRTGIDPYPRPTETTNGGDGMDSEGSRAVTARR